MKTGNKIRALQTRVKEAEDLNLQTLKLLNRVTKLQTDMRTCLKAVCPLNGKCRGFFGIFRRAWWILTGR